jgi:methionyl-tRNA synthetase
MSEEIKTPDVISFEDFLKVDIRAGTIISAERVEKSKKLLKFQVDFGALGTRQILAGIGHKWNPENIVNYQALFVINLPPREMMGLKSEGMILAAASGENDDGLWLYGHWDSGVKNGSRLG